MEIIQTNKRSKGYIGCAFLFLIIVFVCEGCNTCWQCPEVEKDENEVTIGVGTEELVEVKFESQEARKLFFNAICKKERKREPAKFKGAILYFPHILFWNEGDIEIVSQNTVINEHIRSCDTNDNLVITDNEAKIYHDANKVGEENE